MKVLSMAIYQGQFTCVSYQLTLQSLCDQHTFVNLSDLCTVEDVDEMISLFLYQSVLAVLFSLSLLSWLE